VERPRNLPDLLHPERPDLGVLPVEAEVLDRRCREVAGRALREKGYDLAIVLPGSLKSAF
jgi:ADP-heptose:LPS heptosyltransferase